MRRWRIVAAVAVLVAASLQGCGTSPHRTASGADPKRPKISFPIRRETHEDIVVAVEECDAGVALATWLPVKSRKELEGTCNAGLKHGLTEVRLYGEQVCGEIAFTIPPARASEKLRIFHECEAKTAKFEPTMHNSFHP